MRMNAFNFSTLMHFCLVVVFQLSLHDHTLGETPVHLSADFMTLAASHYHSHAPTSINISTTTFKLPHNIYNTSAARDLNSNETETVGGRDCFQARATAYQQNPYAYKEDQLAKVCLVMKHSCICFRTHAHTTPLN